jgi:hypothetical protein
VPPDLEDFKPTGTPDGPLSKATDWVNVTLDGKAYKRETNTMPQWAGSCWYFLRFIDPKNPAAFAARVERGDGAQQQRVSGGGGVKHRRYNSPRRCRNLMAAQPSGMRAQYVSKR